MIVHIQQRIECVVVRKQVLVHHPALVVGVVAVISGIPVAPASLIDGQLGLPLSLDFVVCGNELSLPGANGQTTEGSVLEGAVVVGHVWNTMAIMLSWSVGQLGWITLTYEVVRSW